MSDVKKSSKQDAIREAVAGIEKTYGQGAIMRLGERAVEPVAVIPTGSLAIDEALGVGGFPRGRIVEVFGPESSGKTTLTLLRRKPRAALPRSSTPSTPSTCATRAASAST
jgi:RecA/RadA recombinase